MATGARLLILDEPFANLDPASCIQIARTLRELNRQGLTMLIVDHRPDYWKSFLTRVLLLEKGDRPPVCTGRNWIPGRKNLRHGDCSWMTDGCKTVDRPRSLLKAV